MGNIAQKGSLRNAFKDVPKRKIFELEINAFGSRKIDNITSGIISNFVTGVAK